MKTIIVVLFAVLSPGLVAAQTSASHKLEEHVLNAGGVPLNGTVLSSASHQMTLGAIGKGVAAASSTSASFVMIPGFVGAYPPPGEVIDLRFNDSTTLAWGAEPTIGVYNLYQGSINTPFDAGYGTCATQGIPGQVATVSTTPPPNGGLFYLVTAENRISEEGTKGPDSAGLERANSSPCP